LQTDKPDRASIRSIVAILIIAGYVENMCLRKAMQDDRRNPYCPFKPELMGDYLGKRKILSAERFSLGKSNTSYKLKLSDGEICVVKLYANSKARREGYLMEFAAGLVPVPEELYRGDDWAIFPFISGQSKPTPI